MAAFAVLAAATVAAFLVAQRLKRAPSVVTHVRASAAFSPNGDGRRDVMHMTFRLRAADVLSATVVTAAGGTEVRRLVSDRPVGRRVHLRWNGRTDTGAVAPPGDYRVRVRLARAGRVLTLFATFALDLAAPRPRVRLAQGTWTPGDGPVTVRYRLGGGRHGRFTVHRTGRPDAAPVATFRGGHHGRRRWRPRHLPAGRYLVTLRVIDRAGNVGVTPSDGAAARRAVLRVRRPRRHRGRSARRHAGRRR